MKMWVNVGSAKDLIKDKQTRTAFSLKNTKDQIVANVEGREHKDMSWL